MGGDGAGGIAGLVELIERDGEAIDYDLQALSLSVADLFTGRLTLRRLRDLLANMPLDGTAVWRKHRRAKPSGERVSVEPPDDFWTPDRDLMAATIDAIVRLNWSLAGRKGSSPPSPISRPGAGRPSSVGTVTDRETLARAFGYSDPGGEERDQERRPEPAEDHPGDGESGAA